MKDKTQDKIPDCPHINYKVNALFLRSTVSKTDCGEKQIEIHTIISINANSSDTISIQYGNNFSPTFMIILCFPVLT